MPDSNIPVGYVTVQEAASRLRVSRTKVWMLIKEGVLVTSTDVLDRRRRLIAVEDLARLVDRRVVKEEPAAKESGATGRGTESPKGP